MEASIGNKATKLGHRE